MKKEYSTPIVEKIAFNYRDQVVAASSTENSQSGTSQGPGFTDINGDGQYGWDDVVTDIVTMNFFDICN